MKIITIYKIAALTALASIWACTTPEYQPMVVAEESMVQNCSYVDTISELSDPGNMIIPFENKKYYGGERKVLIRTNGLGATHIVWLHNLQSGSSATLYRCEE